MRLLPHFDAFAVGSQPRELLFPGAAWDRALSRSQAGNFPVMLVDSVVAGVWHQRKAAGKKTGGKKTGGKEAGGRVAVTVEPLRTLTARQREQLAEQVDRVGSILEARPTLTIGPITVGPHA